MTLATTYDPAAIEAKFTEVWETSGAYGAHPEAPGNKTPFTIMMPPPNVTGSLHMGHALTFTLQDALVRYQRMRGRDVLWQPGTDHAGIATQMVVERNLAAEGLDRRTLGREAFLKKVWEWKAQSGGTITRQLRRLGASCDWSRERFTLDEGLNKAVTRVFVQLFKEGLIYQDTRLVNWDPKLQTAVSDLEVEQREVKGHLWYLKYPIEGEDGTFITVATTRPETMLGDVAVAVHPEHPTLSALIGKSVRLPLTDRVIPIIGDTYADPEKGTGAVKITPAHDFNDYEVGRRHGLTMLSVLDKEARLNESVPEAYRGLDRFDARKRIVADLEALGLLEKIEPHVHVVPHGDRSGVVLEPYLTTQWYCDAPHPSLGGEALKAVQDGRTRFVPQLWENTYFSWMENLQPWCISRQLWWGHQIPAWYGPDGHVFVAETEAEAQQAARQHDGRMDITLRRDEDVLDTWFSSALWPFSTLGWPETTPELERYYPTQTLITGFDIIFFWVARMMMLSLKFTGQVPFKDIYIHALVRDEKGQKMSKTKGNVLDPLEVIDRYGCDALRFTLANLSTPGRDIRLAPARIEGGRNFATKLWNATRYSLMQGCKLEPAFDPAAAQHVVNRWIIGQTKTLATRVTAELDAYRFDLASGALYAFVWDVFCDRYLEFTKPILAGTSPEAARETRQTTAWVLSQVVRLLHPFTPFITEELWENLGGTKPLITAPWPDLESLPAAPEAEITFVQRVISEIRAVRSLLNVPPSSTPPLHVVEAPPALQGALDRHRASILRMARVGEIVDAHAAESPLPLEERGTASLVVGEAVLRLPLAGIIDLDKERTRLTSERERLTSDLQKTEAKLADPTFTGRAKPEVVEEHRARKTEAEATLARLASALAALGG